MVQRCHVSHHQGVQLILAYIWARPAILVAGKGRGGMFLFLLFLYFHSCSSFLPVPLFHLLYYLFDLFSPFLWEMTQNDPQGLTCLCNQKVLIFFFSYFSKKRCCGYSLEAPCWDTFSEYPQHVFMEKLEQYAPLIWRYWTVYFLLELTKTRMCCVWYEKKSSLIVNKVPWINLYFGALLSAYSMIGYCRKHRIYLKYWNTLAPNHTSAKNWTN